VTGRQDLAALVRAIIDTNRYMVLATADQDGRPWASPVFFAADGYRDFLLDLLAGGDPLAQPRAASRRQHRGLPVPQVAEAWACSRVVTRRRRR